MKFLSWMYAGFVAALLLLVAAAGHCQTAILLPDPHPQFFDVNGNPLAGGKVFTFLAGTAIAQQTYIDSTASTLNANPVVLDSGGFPSCSGSSCGIYLANGVSYRIVVQNSLGIQQWVADNVKLVNSAQVGGANTQVQYNCAGAFCGSSNFTWNNGSQTLTVSNLVVNTGGTLSGSYGGNPVFTGTVTFSGTVNFAAITANSLTSTCANPASAGFIRMCKTDAVNWRNNANSADYGLTTSADANDYVLLSSPGGLILSGANPNLRFGGTNNTFPMLKRNSNGINVRLADDSNDAAISAFTLGFNGPSGPAIGGSCTAGQVLTATSSVAVSCQTSPSSAQLVTTTTATGTAIGASNTTWVTKAVTMPATGCPCRALVSYGAYYTSGASGTATFWVEDGTSSFATSRCLTNTAGGNAGGCNAGAMSPNTYSNGAVITFIGRGYSDAAGSITTAATPFGSTQNPWLNITVFTSN
jgi:hypothetical protein